MNAERKRSRSRSQSRSRSDTNVAKREGRFGFIVIYTHGGTLLTKQHEKIRFNEPKRVKVVIVNVSPSLRPTAFNNEDTSKYTRVTKETVESSMASDDMNGMADNVIRELKEVDTQLNQGGLDPKTLQKMKDYYKDSYKVRTGPVFIDKEYSRTDEDLEPDNKESTEHPFYMRIVLFVYNGDGWEEHFILEDSKAPVVKIMDTYGHMSYNIKLSQLVSFCAKQWNLDNIFIVDWTCGCPMIDEKGSTAGDAIAFNSAERELFTRRLLREETVNGHDAVRLAIPVLDAWGYPIKKKSRKKDRKNARVTKRRRTSDSP